MEKNNKQRKVALLIFVLSVLIALIPFTSKTQVIKPKKEIKQRGIYSATPSCDPDSLPGINYALVVGISQYPNLNNQLYFADDDAFLFYDYLVSEKVCQKDNIALLIDSMAKMPNIYAQLTRLLTKVKYKDTVIIYFAGHGDVETELESGYLLTYDCNSTNYAASAIDISKLEKYINAYIKKQARVMLIVDACRSGNLAGGIAGASTTMKAFSLGFEQADKLLSCQPSQLSEERVYPDGGHGVFTYHLVEGLRGLADKNNDGSITMRELDFYLEKVAEETKNKQIPKLLGNPQNQLSRYDVRKKRLLASQKTNLSNTQIGLYRSVEKINDTIDPYRQFWNCLKQGNLIDPPGNNAFEIIRMPDKNLINNEQLEEMKIALQAILENEAQKWLQLFINSDERRIKNFYSQATYIKNLRIMDSCLALVSEDNNRYNEIKAKSLFFHGVYQYNQPKTVRINRDKSLNWGLDFFLAADSILPNQAWILNLIGNCYRLIGEFDVSLSYHKRVTNLTPNWKNNWNNLGSLYVEKINPNQKTGPADIKLLEDAENCFRKALSLDTINSSYALCGLGEVSLKFDKIKDAEMFLLKSLEKDSNDAYTLQYLGILNNKNRNYPLSEKFYRRAIAIDSNSYFYKLGLLRALSAQKKFDPQYVYLLQNILVLKPTEINHWIALKSLNAPIDKNLYLRATDELKSILINDSLNSVAWQAMGAIQTYFEKNMLEAEKCMKMAFKIEPSPINHYNLSCFYSMNNKKSESLYYLQLALEKGFVDFGLIEADPDLSNLRSEKEYLSLIKRYKSKKKTVSKD